MANGDWTDGNGREYADFERDGDTFDCADDEMARLAAARREGRMTHPTPVARAMAVEGAQAPRRASRTPRRADLPFAEIVERQKNAPDPRAVRQQEEAERDLRRAERAQMAHANSWNNLPAYLFRGSK